MKQRYILAVILLLISIQAAIAQNTLSGKVTDAKTGEPVPGVIKPVIRGLSMTNILVLKNGVRLENFQFSENHPFLVNEKWEK
ncbi:MAG: hypothetical protein K9I94_06930 [Bacteroidales bacterium]|nr:hypothetical protein [Bacteroidales bacterium]